jgi:hypothetical protein
MKKKFKKVVTATASLALAASMLISPIAADAVTSKTGYFNSGKDIAVVKTAGGCGVMQGLAVGNKWLYAAKIKSDDTKAFMVKVNKSTGETVRLVDESNGSKFMTYLGHANDMCPTTINDKTNLFVVTMKANDHGLVRMRVNGSNVKKVGNYTLRWNGINVAMAGVSVFRTTSSSVTLLFNSGCDFFYGTINNSTKSGVINLTKAFSINISNIKINGSTVNASNYIHQGFTYHDGNIFVPLTCNTNTSCSIVPVYNVSNVNASSVVTSNRNLSFRITSGTYANKYEIESCGISPTDGKLYYNTNRAKAAGDADYDAIHVFKNFVF